MSYIRAVIFVLCFLPLSTFATDCDELLSASFSLPETSSLDFHGVEVYRRNNGISPQQYGDLQFAQWLVLGESDALLNILGLTPDGRLFHLIQFKKEERRIARLLNGKRKFKTFLLSHQRILLAQDERGKTYVYSPSLWSKSPGPDIIKKGGLVWMGSTAALTAALHLAWGLDDFPTAAFVASVNAFHISFAALQFFETANTYPDGFVPVANGREYIKPAGPKELTAYSVEADFMPPDIGALAPLLPEAAREEIR